MNCRVWITFTLFTLATSFAAAQPPKKNPADFYSVRKPKKANTLDDYLSKEEKLVATLEIRDEKRGFGVFFGTHYRIQPDGSWSSTRIYRNRPRIRGKGVLKKEDLKKLAKVLADADVLTLPSAGQRFANPHVVSIAFGPRRATLTFGIDQKLPSAQAVPGRPDISGRYSVVFGAVQGLIEPLIGPEPPLPVRLR